MRSSPLAEQNLQLEEYKMYSNPKHIKKNAYKVSLNDDQHQLIEMASDLAGLQPSAYIRELALERLREILEINDNLRDAG